MFLSNKVHGCMWDMIASNIHSQTHTKRETNFNTKRPGLNTHWLRW